MKIMSRDRISNLPPAILHKIMALLDLKDLTKTMVLSKSFLSTWTTFPVLELDHVDFLRTLSKDTKHGNIRDLFFTFLDNIIRRRKLSNLVLQKFKLRGPIGLYISHVNRAVSFALENRVMEFSLFPTPSFTTQIPYSLPQIKGGQFLKKVTLTGIHLDLNDLILHCPGIEELKIAFCQALKEIKFSSRKIKSVTVSECDMLKSVDIDSTSLLYFDIDSKNQCEINVSKCEVLEKLEVMSDSVTPTWVEENVNKLVNLKELVLYRFHLGRLIWSTDINACINLETLHLVKFHITQQLLDQVYRFAGLQCLKLYSCSSLERVDIVNLPQLKTLELRGCSETLAIVNIIAPKLVSFSYDGPVIPFCAVTSRTLLHTTLSLLSVSPLDFEYFVALKKIIDHFAHSQNMILSCQSASELIFPENVREQISCSQCWFKHLTVVMPSSQTVPTAIVESLLWLSPRLESLRFVSGDPFLLLPYSHKTKLLIKFGYGMRVVKEENAICCKRSLTGCWRCSLKAVQIENFGTFDVKSMQKYFETNTMSPIRVFLK